jgi:hypothetical protein
MFRAYHYVPFHCPIAPASNLFSSIAVALLRCSVDVDKYHGCARVIESIIFIVFFGGCLHGRGTRCVELVRQREGCISESSCKETLIRNDA